MRGILVGAFLLATMAALLWVGKVTSEEKPQPTVAKPLLTLYGQHSKTVKDKLVRVTTGKEWRSVWLEHKTGSPNPDKIPADVEQAELDFEKVMVVAVFKENKGAEGYFCHSIIEDRNQIKVRVWPVTRQTGIGTPPGDECGPRQTSDKSRAWAIIALPRSSKELVLEHDVRLELPDPPKWEKWVTFPAIAEKSKP